MAQTLTKSVLHPVHPGWQVVVTDRSVYVRPGVQVLVHRGKTYRTRFWRRNKLNLSDFIRVGTKNIWKDGSKS